MEEERNSELLPVVGAQAKVEGWEKESEKGGGFRCTDLQGTNRLHITKPGKTPAPKRSKPLRTEQRKSG